MRKKWNTLSGCLTRFASSIKNGFPYEVFSTLYLNSNDFALEARFQLFRYSPIDGFCACS